MKALVLTLRFLTELAMLGILGWWGVATGGSLPADLALGLGAPLAAATVWGMWVAPKARTRLEDPTRLVVEIVLFDLAAAALWDLAGLRAALAYLGVAGALAVATRRVGEELA